MNRSQFLEARRSGLGATDLANLAGVGFHNDPQLIWRSKVERIDADAGNVLMLMGLATEELNAELYAAGMDTAICKPSEIISRHPEHEWAAASLDRITVTDNRPVELKYTPFFSESRWGESLTDQVPAGYVVQTTWQSGIVGSELADLSVLAGTGEHRIYRTMHDRELFRLLFEIGREFWFRFVVTKEEPPANWRAEAAPDVSGRILAIHKDRHTELAEEYGALAEQYVECRKIAKDAEEEANRLRNRIELAMGENGKATAGRMKVSKWLVPEAVITPEPYTRKAYVGFRITELKGKD